MVKDLYTLSRDGAQGARLGEMRQKGRRARSLQNLVDQAKAIGLNVKAVGF